MYLADIRAECGLCRHVQVQRYYHSTPAHSVTVKTLCRLALEVRDKTLFDCPNCGTEVAPEHALSTAFTWAFADEAGLIRAFLPDAHDDTTLRWQFVSRHRLDPQELPGWEPVDGEDTYDALDDDDIEQQLGRPLNPKAAIRGVLLAWRADRDKGAVASIGPHMTIFAGGAAPAGAISLADCVPHGLPTHRDPALMSGRLDGWLPDVAHEVSVEIAAQSAIDVIERAFAVANLTAERTDEGWANITTPRDSPYPRDLPLHAVLRRAVYTGMTPGDAARLTAEEIVGTLLRVW